MKEVCLCCDTIVVLNEDKNINIHATCEALIERCTSGKMKVIRGDCPLEMMEKLLNSDPIYSIVQFIHCNICNRTIFWGLWSRGVPIYKVVEEKEIEQWPWKDDKFR